MASLPHPAPRSVSRPATADVALAVLLFVFAALEMLLSDFAAPPEAKVVGATLTTLPLAWRTAAPVPMTGVATGGYVLAVTLGFPPEAALFPIIAPIVAVYTVGAQGTVRDLAVAALLGTVPYSAAILATGPADTEEAVYIAAVLGALLVGRAIRAMGFEVDVLEARTTALERERDEAAVAAVADERARIARELHDLIGHSISVMGLQAGAVRRLLGPGQERERDVLLGVERTGRDAVAEMHRLLGFLREDGEDGAAPALPTVRRLDDLIADVRRAGLDVELTVEGELDDLTPGRALAAFRILQEALTNVLKHAPDARVRAAVRRTAADLSIDVVDDGRGARTAPATAGGHGIVGMRERVALYGGTLSAAPTPEGGFAVHARLPTAVP